MPVLPPPHVIDHLRKRKQPSQEERPFVELPMPLPMQKPAPTEPQEERGVVIIDYTVDFVVG